MLDQLSPNDRVSIVLFSDEACTALPLSPVDCVPLNDLKEAITRDIQPLSSTNIEAGLNMSIDVLEGCRECMKADPNEWENRVIVLTGMMSEIEVLMIDHVNINICLFTLYRCGDQHWGYLIEWSEEPCRCCRAEQNLLYLYWHRA